MTIVRPSTAADLAAITAIYAHHVLNSTATFETEAPSAAEMGKRRDDVLAKGLPYLVIEDEGQIKGYAYANWFKPRAAYRFTCENSIYMHTGSTGKGLGRLLLSELLSQLERASIRKVLAVIGGSGNAASIGLHSALGFAHCGLVENYGYKFDQWLDLVLMQRELGLGARAAPL